MRDSCGNVYVMHFDCELFYSFACKGTQDISSNLQLCEFTIVKIKSLIRILEITCFCFFLIGTVLQTQLLFKFFFSPGFKGGRGYVSPPPTLATADQCLCWLLLVFLNRRAVHITVLEPRLFYHTYSFSDFIQPQASNLLTLMCWCLLSFYLGPHLSRPHLFQDA